MARWRRFSALALALCLLLAPISVGGTEEDGEGILPFESRELAQPLEKLPLVVLDPGHGGADTGAVGPSGLTEAEVAWAVASALKVALERERVARVVLTRSKDNNPSLAERTALANAQGAVLFVSLHLGAAFHPGAKGASAYVASAPGRPGEVALNGDPRELFRPTRRRGRTARATPVLWEAVQAPHRMASMRACETILAALASEELVEAGELHAADLPLLKGAAMPACLIELATLTHPAEEAVLRQEATRQALVEVLLRKGIGTALEGGSP